MEKMTITEALSEVNLIKKKLDHKKRNFVPLTVKAEHAKDPYESEGGSSVYLKKELQSIEDLYKRLIRIRSAISKANIETDITIGERTQSIHDWLTWKREISKDETSFINSVVTGVAQAQKDVATKPSCYDAADGTKKLLSLQVNVDYPAFVKKQEEMATLFEQLDGKLSLKNATIVVTIN